MVQTDGPRTRSRATKMPKPCDKEVKRVEVQTDHQVATFYSSVEFFYQFHLNYKYMISISILYTIIL